MKLEIERLCFLYGNKPEEMLETLETSRLDDRGRLLEALKKTDWNHCHTAAILGISEGGVRYRMNKYGLVQDADA